jgi:DNA-directed RNA polymerase subunit M/transcription elongation factor TFIIS
LIQRQLHHAEKIYREEIEAGKEVKVVEDSLTSLLFKTPESQSINTDLWQQRKDKKAKIAQGFSLLKNLEEFKFDDVQSVIKCTKCKNTDIIFESRQSSAADEPATIKCFCTKCHKRWQLNR